MPLIYITTKVFEDSLPCGSDTTNSVRYHLRASKVYLSLKLDESGYRVDSKIARSAARVPTLWLLVHVLPGPNKQREAKQSILLS